jgi:uncharacterized membrane protein
MKLTLKSKRWLLIIHILFAAIMIGNMVAFLIFSMTAALAGDKDIVQTCYQAMHILSKTSVKASTIATTVTGILLSLWTKWGLVRYYWILAKEGLTALVIGLNLWGMYAWTLEALSLYKSGGSREDIFDVQIGLWAGILIQIVSLVLMYIISVFKPWGKRVKVTS